VSVPKECVLVYRTGLQSSATGFLMPDQRHFLSLYSYSLVLTWKCIEFKNRLGLVELYSWSWIVVKFNYAGDDLNLYTSLLNSSDTLQEITNLQLVCLHSLVTPLNFNFCRKIDITCTLGKRFVILLSP